MFTHNTPSTWSNAKQDGLHFDVKLKLTSRQKTDPRHQGLLYSIKGKYTKTHGKKRRQSNHMKMFDMLKFEWMNWTVPRLHGIPERFTLDSHSRRHDRRQQVCVQHPSLWKHDEEFVRLLVDGPNGYRSASLRRNPFWTRPPIFARCHVGRSNCSDPQICQVPSFGTRCSSFARSTGNKKPFPSLVNSLALKIYIYIYMNESVWHLKCSYCDIVYNEKVRVKREKKEQASKASQGLTSDHSAVDI